MLGLCVYVLSVARLCEHVTRVITHTPRLGWLGLVAMPDRWRWRERVGLVRFDGCARLVEVEIVMAGSDQWCWLDFFFWSQVVGRSGFSRSRSVGSISGFGERLRCFALCCMVELGLCWYG